MPKRAEELSAIQVKRLAKVPGKHAVGGVAGLLLDVSPSTAKDAAPRNTTASWLLRIMVGDRRRDVGLGAYPDVTLEQARSNARQAREQVRQGVDPIAARKAAQDALRAAAGKALTFDQAAKRAHQAKAPEFRNKKHSAQWINTLTTYASPKLGTLPVSAVELPHVIEVLNPIWTTKTETATRVRQRIEAVLSWATVNGYREGPNPAAWSGNLEHALPKARKIKRVKHHPAVPWQEMGAFVVALRKRKGTAARALEFLVLTAARSNEVRFATWDEIDLKAKLWTIPGERMKGGRAHRVPLSDSAIEILKTLPRMKENELVFVGRRGKELSDGTLAKIMADLELEAVPHGCRSSFKDWARSSTAYPDEASELALAHVSNDRTRAAYARDELLPIRARLMRDWAKYLATARRKANVVPIRAATPERAP